MFGPAAARSVFNSLRCRVRDQLHTRTKGRQDALEDEAVRPVVCDCADEHHVWVDDGADAGDIEGALRLEEVVRMIRQTARVEDLSVSPSPGLWPTVGICRDDGRWARENVGTIHMEAATNV